MRNSPYKILAEKYNSSTWYQPVVGKYIYFIQDDELFQLKPYKQIVSPGVKILFLAPNWKKATVMQGEDVRDILGQEVYDPSQWFIVDDSAPKDHTFEVYIGY